jgi:hypothetical protein
MASSYTTNSGIEKPAAGDQSGTWGGTVNTNMDIIDTIVSGFIQITAGSTSVNLTTTDGSVTAGMNRALKYVDGGDLGGNCTVTITPNDQEKLIFVDNGLSASRSLIFSQGSGANFTLQNGKQAIIKSDGAGSGAAVAGVYANIQISTLECEGAAAIDGALTAGGGVAVTGNVTATGTVEPAGDTAAADNAAIGYTSAEGLILTGQGSTNDVTIKNDTDADVITIATGATNVDVVGDLTAGTLNADGDTAAGDNAVMGYTSAEGLILTGQGSTNDVTIKNDADADVIKIPTGTTNVTIVGNLTTATGGIATASLADNAVTLAKMAGGTDGNIISYDASGDPVAVATGNDGQVLTSTGAGSPPAFEDASGGGFTEGTEVTPTSGQSAAFTSIPSGTKVIFVTWSGVSFNDYSYLKIQLGDSGGLEASGYVGTTMSIYGGTITQGVPASGRATSSTYFVMGGSNGSYGMAASVSIHGTATLTLEDSTNNTWGFTSMMCGAGLDMDWSAGSKSLSGELTQLAVQSGAVGSEASAAFDAGNINIVYSG